jgi:hypothetical protein
MSKNNKKYFYKTLAMSNDINQGRRGQGDEVDLKEKGLISVFIVCQIFISKFPGFPVFIT